MKWEKISAVKPDDGQLCWVRPMAQLSFFDNPDDYIRSSIRLCEYSGADDCFFDAVTKKKMKSPMYWSPAENMTVGPF